MDEILKYLGMFSVSTIAAFGFIKALSKLTFENYLKKRIESHKSELERLNFSFQIQFSSLHKERAIVIKHLYFSLYDYKLAVMDFFGTEINESKPFEHLEHKIENWTKAVLNFSPLFHKNKIFFSTGQVELMNSINNEMESINIETKQFLSQFNSIQCQIGAINSKSEEFMRLKTKCDISLKKTLHLERYLENEFRKILGVEIK